MAKIVTAALQNQLESCSRMLSTLVERIPDGLWYAPYHGVPFWKQVFHAVYFLDFWIREKYDGSDFRSMAFDERITPELEQAAEHTVSRGEMKEYHEKIRQKTEKVFDRLSDADMARPVVEGAEHYTYADVAAGQLRRIMQNIGYCNGYLRSHGPPEADWYAYNEMPTE